jgi:hypothetical protein
MKTSWGSTRLARCLAESRPPRCFTGPLTLRRGGLCCSEGLSQVRPTDEVDPHEMNQKGGVAASSMRPALAT